MKIAPLNTMDPWFGHVANHNKAFVETLVGVPVEAVVLIEEVSILHTPERNFRPFLHLRGRLTAIGTPEVELPYGITELEFAPGHGPQVDAFYEFDNEQLAELVTKGYFETGFSVPATMIGIPWILPGKARIQFVSPETMDEPPIVFLELIGANDLRVDARNSGYELAAYFPDYTSELTAQREANEQYSQDRAIPVVEHDDVDHGFTVLNIGEDRDLFADEPARERQREHRQEGVLPGEAFEQFSRVPKPDEAGAQQEQCSEDEMEAVQAEEMYQRNVAGPLADEARREAAFAAKAGGWTVPSPTVKASQPEDQPSVVSSSSTEHRGFPLFDEGFLEFEADENIQEADGEMVFESDGLFLAETQALESDVAAEYVQDVVPPTPEDSARHLGVDNGMQAALESAAEEGKERRLRRERHVAALQAERDAHSAGKKQVEQPAASTGQEPEAGSSSTGELELD